MKKVSEMTLAERFELKSYIPGRIEFCEMILKMSDKPFIIEKGDVWGAIISFQGATRLRKMQEELTGILELHTGTQQMVQQIALTCTTDEEWNAQRNKDLSYVVFTKHTLKPEFVTIINEYFTRRLSELNAQLAEIKQIETAWRLEREAKKNSMQVKVINRGSVDTGDGTDIFANVEITDENETLKFACRNISDFGFIINPMYSIVKGKNLGGIRTGDFWQDFTPETGWTNVRELTEFEKKCLDYLCEFSPIETEIRM